MDGSLVYAMSMGLADYLAYGWLGLLASLLIGFLLSSQELRHILYIAIVFALTVLALNRVVQADDRPPVVVIDTGLDLHDPRFTPVLCPSGHKDYTGTGLQDDIGHGTHVAGLIKKYAEGSYYCLVIYKYYQEKADGLTNTMRFLTALRDAIDSGTRLVNLSSGGYAFREAEYLTLKEAKNVTFVTAVGNDSKPEAWYPAAYGLPNVIGVGARGIDGNPYWKSNRGKFVKAWEPGELVLSTLPGGYEGRMTGTSMSTAIHTGKLIKRGIHAKTH